MSKTRIEKLFQNIQSTSDRLDEIYAERRSIIESLATHHAKASELKDKKNTFIVHLNSINRDIDNNYLRINSYNEWAKKSNYPESKIIAEKNTFALKQNILKLKSKKEFYKSSIAQIQSELDSIYQKITELNIQKKKCNEEINSLRQKKDEYKRKIDSIKGKK